MQLSVKGRNLEITDALRQYAEEKLGRLTKYLGQIVSASVVLSVEKHRHLAEVTLRVRELTIRAEESTADLDLSSTWWRRSWNGRSWRYKERIVARPPRDGPGGAGGG